MATGILQFDKGELLNCFKAFYDSWGFITWYIILYFVSPVLNVFAEKKDSKQLMTFIIIFWFAEVFIMRSTDGIDFCLVYLVGRWLAKVGTEKYAMKSGWGYFTVTLIIFFCSYMSYRILHFDAAQMGGFILGYNYASPFVITQAVFLFLAFSKIQIQSKVINWMAASCLSIFLIHMHPAIKQIGYYSFTESLYDKPFWEHTVILILLISVVFFGSILVDKARIVVSDILYSFMGWIKRKVIKKEITLSL